MKFISITLAVICSFALFTRSTAAPGGPAVTKQNPEQNDSGKKLKILSWNIYMMPKMMVQRGKMERAEAIVQHLQKSDFDIIVFEEAFLPKARAVIEKGLDSLYPYRYGPINGSLPAIKTNGGVWILSKLDLKVLKTIQYKDCATWDCLARKGAVLLEGTWNGKTFQLLGTHLQADKYQEVRYKQMDAVYTELLAPFRRDGVPQLICGDMNTEAEIKERYCAMLDCFDAQNGEISGIEKCTYDGVNNNIAQSFGVHNKTTYDYILVRNNGLKLKSIRRFVSIMKKGKKQLSDHYGIVCEVDF